MPKVNLSTFLIPALILFIPLYPKFPLVFVTGTFVSVRLEDILVAVSAAFTVWIYFRQKLFPAVPLLGRSIILYLIIAFCAVFSGIFLTKTAALGLGLLHAFRRVEYMSLFFTGYFLMKKVSNLGYYIRLILLVSLFIALYGLGQQFLQFPVITTTNSEFSKGLALSLGTGARINSTFAGHYDFAAFLLFPLLLCLALLSVSRPKWPVIITGALSYWVLLLSASRITFASFFISAALLLVIIRKKLWLVPLCIITFLGVMLSPQLRGRYGELFVNHFNLSLIPRVSAQGLSRDVNAVPDALKPPAEPEDRSFNIRLKAEWPKALRAFYLNPFFGSGFSSIGLAADNDYLRTLAETGILGLLAFLLIFTRFFKTVSSRLLHYSPGPENAFIVFVVCAVFGLLLNALFIDIFAASKIAIITWLFIGLAVKTYDQTS